MNFEGYYNEKDIYIIKLLEHRFESINDYYLKVFELYKIRIKYVSGNY